MSDDNPSITISMTMTFEEWLTMIEILASHDHGRHMAQGIVDWLAKLLTSGSDGVGVQ